MSRPMTSRGTPALACLSILSNAKEEMQICSDVSGLLVAQGFPWFLPMPPSPASPPSPPMLNIFQKLFKYYNLSPLEHQTPTLHTTHINISTIYKDSFHIQRCISSYLNPQKLEIKLSPFGVISIYNKYLMSFWKKVGKQLGKATHVVDREVKRMVDYSNKAGQTKENIISVKNIGGEITKRQRNQICNFTTLMEMNDLALQMYPQLRDLAVGQIAGQKHVIQKSNNHRVYTGIAVRKIDDARFGFSFVQIERKVEYSEPKQETQKDVTVYFDVAVGLGGRTSNKRTDTVLRPLTELQKQRIEQALSEEGGPSVKTIAETNLYEFEG